MLENSTYGLNAIKNSATNVLSSIITDSVNFDSDDKPRYNNFVTTTINGAGILLYYHIYINGANVNIGVNTSVVQIQISIDDNVETIKSLGIGNIYNQDKQYLYIPFKNKCVITTHQTKQGTIYNSIFGAYNIMYALFN